jgi:hypothetical protein
MQNGARVRMIGRSMLASVLSLMMATAASQQVTARATGIEDHGQHDFDWETGTWKTHVRRLAKPLSGAGEWVEYDGTTIVGEVLDGRANLVELRVQGPSGAIHGTSLRLYNPQARQWSIHYASMHDGLLTRPLHGAFRDGRGEFHGEEDLDGRAIFVRFVITRPTPDSARFEQSYSADGGRTWELNWVASDTRIAE